MTSWIRTSAVTDCEHSLMSPVPAMCECSSMIPAVTCLPVPSITRAEGSFNPLPIAAILPFFNNTSLPVKTPNFSFVQTVAFLIKIVSDEAGLAVPYPANGKITEPNSNLSSFLPAFFATVSAAADADAFHETQSPFANWPVPVKVAPANVPLKRVRLPLSAFEVKLRLIKDSFWEKSTDVVSFAKSCTL